MNILRRAAVPVLSLWLLGWMVISWPAIQDDALIHLRYADFLHRVHFITFDGVHPSFGTSSLLYVALLAILRSLTTTPVLSRAVSTVVHCLLFVGLAVCYQRAVSRKASQRVQLLALSLMALIAAPSAVRWLDDGMETGIVLLFVGGLAIGTQRLSLRERIKPAEYTLTVAGGFALVMLRIELGVAALLATVILALSARSHAVSTRPRSIFAGSGFLLGALFAAVAVRVSMHAFLPDTAIAKAHGISGFLGSIIASAAVLTGGLVFGLGFFILWLLSFAVVLTRTHTRRLSTLAANALFPFVLLSSALRGQEIQGARYLVWTFFFSIVWNLFELWSLNASGDAAASTFLTLDTFSFFLLACILALPIDARFMFRTLTTRVHTMSLFRSHDLATTLSPHLGAAGDVGYIAYFSQSPICDLSGLVNGREAAALSIEERAARCARLNPAFLFTTSDQTGAAAQYLDLSQWKVCGQYDLGDLRFPDRHYLVVRPELAVPACAANHFAAEPASFAIAAPQGY